MKQAMQTYLLRHFITTQQLAHSVGVEVDVVQRLVLEQRVPMPSYRVDSNGLVHSCVFGELTCIDLPAQDFYPPAQKFWVQTALKHNGDRDAITLDFARHYYQALNQIEDELKQHSALFKANEIDNIAAAARLHDIQRFFLQGVFGVCVVQPDNLVAILRKELAQDALALLTDNGQKTQFSEIERRTLKPIMAIYDQVTMPFSPFEYPRSSRKRLLDDLRSRMD